MKRKLFFLLVLVFGFCGVLGYVNLKPAQVSYAVSSNSSSWNLPNGKTYKTLTEADFNINDSTINNDYYKINSEIYIGSAKGFAYFAVLANEEANNVGQSKFAGTSVYLTTDIDLKNVAWNPIQNFRGSFYGQGHYIFNLKLEYIDGVSDYGIFGSILGTLSMLNLRNVDIDIISTTANAINVGSLVGRVGTDISTTSSPIISCSAKGEIKVNSEKSFVGGLVGYVNTTGEYENLKSDFVFDVQSTQNSTTNTNVGGLFGGVGQLNLQKSYSEGVITCNVGNVGGLIGIDDVKALNKISTSGNLVLRDSYSKMKLNSTDSNVVGGLVGVYDSDNNVVNRVILYNLYFAGESSNDYGAIIGKVNNPNTTITGESLISITTTKLFGNLDKNNNSFYTKDCFADFNSIVRTSEFYTDTNRWHNQWNFENIWGIAIGMNDSLPFLKELSNFETDNDNFYSGLKGSGTINSPYLIQTAGDLGYLSRNYSKLQNKVFALQNNIDLSGATWIPIGKSSSKFSGVFDGNNFTISGLNCSLQEPFSELGLFGATKNAVIKNLIVKNFNINSTLSNQSVGTIIANADENTYLINCADYNSKEISSVGYDNNGSNLTVAYGQNNEEGQKLNILSNPKIGYDITIDGVGGIFYNENREIYRGQHHVLVYKGSSLSYINVSNIDSSYGKILPQLSENYGETDILIRKGYKLKGFSTKANEVKTIDLDGTGLFVGDSAEPSAYKIFANWEGAKKKIEIVYNAYENELLNAQTMLNASYKGQSLNYEGKDLDYAHIELQDNDVKVVYELDYDSDFSDYYNIFKATPSYTLGETKKLRGEGFDVEEIYSTYSVNGFSDVLSNSYKFINNKLNSTYYAKWKNSELPQSYTIKLRFNKEEMDNSWAGFEKFNFSDVFTSIKLYGWKKNADGIFEKQKNFMYDDLNPHEVDDNYEFTINYNTSFSLSQDEFWRFEVDAERGYEFQLLSLDEKNLDENQNKDSNFGTLVSGLASEVKENNRFDIKIKKEEDKALLENYCFYNLIGNYTFDISIRKKVVTSNLDIGDSIYFAMTPYFEEKINKVEIANYSDSITTTFEDISTDISGDYNFVGYDFVNNQMIFGTQGYAKSTVNLELDDANLLDTDYRLKKVNDALIMRINEEYYFKYTIENRGDLENPFYYVSLYECLDISPYTAQQLVGSISVGESFEITNTSNFYAMSYTNFSLILITDDESTYFVTKVSNYDSEKNINVLGHIAEDESKANKLLYVYGKENFKFVDFDDEEGYIKAIGRYTKAKFDITFKYFDPDNIPDTFTNSVTNPYIKTISQTLDIVENNQFTIEINPNDYFKFYDIEGTAILKDDAKEGIKPENKYNIEITYNVNTLRDASGEDKSDSPYTDDSGAVLKYLTKQFTVNWIKSNSNNNLNFVANNIYYGHYDIVIYLTDVKYSVVFDAKGISLNNLQSFIDGVNDKNSYLADYNLIDIDDMAQNLVTLEINQDAFDFAKETRSSNIVDDLGQGISTFKKEELTTKDVLHFTSNASSAYIFYGWLIRNNIGRYILTNNLELNYDTLYYYSHDYSSIYRSTEGVSNIEHQFTVIAVFQIKQMTFSLSDEILIQNYMGGENQSFIYGNNSLDISGNLKSGSVPIERNAVTYFYKQYDYLKNIPSQNIKNLSVELTGRDIIGYDFVGVEILDSNNERVENGFFDKDSGTLDESNKILFTKDYVDFVNGILEKQIQENKVYYLRVILKQKFIQIVFHSGTGLDNEYGDGKAGYVYDEENEDVTDTTYTTNNIYYGESLRFDDSETISLSDGRMVSASSLFPYRKGYQATGLWQWLEFQSINFTLNAQIYDAKDKDGKIHIFKLWKANDYTITFDALDGVFGNGKNSYEITVKYDSVFDLKNVPTEQDSGLSKVSKVGYELKYWALVSDDTINFFEIDGANSILLYDASNGINKYFIQNRKDNGNFEYIFCFDGEFTLQAVWLEKNYKVKIYYNNGTENFAEEDIKYNASLNEILAKYRALTTGTGPTILRARFSYGGLFPSIKGVVYENNEIVENTTFNNELIGFVDDVDEGLVLYIKWLYDNTEANPNRYEFKILNTEHSSIKYNGQNQEISLFDFLEGDNVDLNGFSLENGIELLEENNAVNMTWTLNEQPNATSFTVKYAGQYSIELAFILTEDDSIKMKATNLSTIPTIMLTILVEKIDVDIVKKDSNEFKALLAKEIMNNYLTEEEKTGDENNFNSLKTLSEIVNFVKRKEAKANISEGQSVEEYISQNFSDISDDLIYEFIIAKYYLLTMCSSGADHILYKSWKYSDYVEFKASDENSALISEIQANTSLFLFYNHNDKNLTNENIISKNKDMIYGLENVSTELKIEEVTVVSTFGSITPRNFADIRVYLTYPMESQKQIILNNYNVEKSGNRYYITFSTVFILPEILFTENNSLEKSVYYRDTNTKIEIDYLASEFEKPSIQEPDPTLYAMFGRNFYLIDSSEMLYVSARAYISNSGSALQDTQFSYNQDKNYIYFDNIIILKRASSSSNNFDNVTSYYKLALNDNCIFTILNVVDVAYLQVQAKYFTFTNGMFYSENATDDEQLLTFTEIAYNLTEVGENKVVSLTQVGDIIVEGTKVGEVISINGNTISMYVNKAIKQVSIKAKQNFENESNFAIYSWSRFYVSQIDAGMNPAENVSYTWNREDEEMEENDLTSIYLYATYTDLVCVDYNLNLPESVLGSNPALTRAYIKLDNTTKENLLTPTISGFKLSKLTYQSEEGIETEYSNLFLNGTGIYVPYNSKNKYASITLKAYWLLNLDENGELYHTTVHEGDYVYKAAVYSFVDAWNSSSLINLSNFSEAIFKPVSYKWYKVGVEKPLSETNSFTLEGKGSYSESGKYRLVVTAEVREELRNSMDIGDDGNKIMSAQVSYEFTLMFMRHKISSIEPSDVNGDYNALDQILDWTLNVQYSIYDNVNDDYSNELISEQINYTQETTGYAKFEIRYNDNLVTEMKNVGSYSISAIFNEEYFDIEQSESLTEGKFTFDYLISAIDFDLTDEDIVLSKNFNTYLGIKEVSTTVTHSSTNEILTIKLLIKPNSEGLYEDIGDYDLVFLGVDGENTKNYNFVKYIDDERKVLYQNGEQTDDGQTVVVGKFTIQKSGGLIVKFKNEPVNDRVTYSGQNFNLQISDDYKITISSSDYNKQYDISLFDINSDSEISNDEILSILSKKLSDLILSFSPTPACVCGTYKYMISMGEIFDDYFSSIQIPNEYEFIIEQKEITINKEIIKVYDGSDLAYLDLEGNILVGEDGKTLITPPLDRDAYIVATFMFGKHFGEGSVLLKLDGQNEVFSNYVVNETTTGKILKMKASVTFTINESFIYGEISQSNFRSKIERGQIISLEDSSRGNVVDEILLAEGYYSIGYEIALTNGQKVNTSNGFYYVGEYTVKVSPSFDDFDMTYNNPTFRIDKKPYVEEISDDYIRVSAQSTDAQVKQALKKIYLDGVTSDQIILNFKVPDLLGDDGQYRLSEEKAYRIELESISSTSGVDVNFDISISPFENNGFRVLPAEQTLYVEFENKDLLNGKIYNAIDYTLSTTLSSFTISNASSMFSTNLIFYTLNDGQKMVRTFEDGTISIYFNVNSDDGKKLKNAGQYVLSLEAEIGSFKTVLFAEDYIFNIGQKELTIENVTKTYDRSASYTMKLNQTHGVCADDSLSIVAYFSSPDVGEYTDVEIHLNNNAVSNNYYLQKDRISGNITKANARVVFDSETAVFGTISKNNEFDYRIIDGLEQEITQYTVSFQINKNTGAVSDSDYSTQGYLHAGTYRVVISATSKNYDINSSIVESFVITPKTISVEFSTPGEIVRTRGSAGWDSTIVNGYFFRTDLFEDIELTLTREPGNVAGYYKILTARVADDKPYSQDYSVDFKGDKCGAGLGAFMIILSDEPLYLLISSERTLEIKNADDGILANTVYDGFIYNNVTVTRNLQDNKYYLELTSTTSELAKLKFELNFYTYAEGVYTLFDDTVVGLDVTIRFSTPITKNVGRYNMEANAATSENYSNIKLGKKGDIFCYVFQITPKKLTLKFNDNDFQDNSDGTKSYVKKFTNRQAEYRFGEQESINLLDGLVEGDNFVLILRMYREAGVLAQYVNSGNDYTFAGEISGQNRNNYDFDYSYVLVGNKQVNIRGARIIPTNLYVRVQNMNFIYGDVKSGQDLGVDYFVDDSIYDFSGYVNTNKDRINIKLVALGGDISNSVSSTGFLNAGNHKMMLEIYNLPDFKVVYRINGGTEDLDSLDSAQLIVSKKTLSISKKDGGVSLRDLFTKPYDGTTNTKNIYDGDTKRKYVFDLNGIILADDISDDVFISNAYYEKATIGNPINIKFELSGEDSENYELLDYNAGIITSIKVKIEFDTQADRGETITSGGRQITNVELEFPFAANDISGNVSSGEFPSGPISGHAGHKFLNWTLIFKNIELNSTKYQSLNRYTGSTSGYNQDAKTWTIVVSDNSTTLNIISNIMNDSNFDEYYYVGKDSVTFIFTANWEINSYNVEINILDENGNKFSDDYDVLNDIVSVTIEGEPIDKTSVTKPFAFNTEINIEFTIKDTRNVGLQGLYIGTRRIGSGDSNFATTQKEIRILRLDKDYIGSDWAINLRFRIKKVKISFNLTEEDAVLNNDSDFILENNLPTYSTDIMALKGKTLNDLYTLADISCYGKSVTSVGEFDLDELQTKFFVGDNGILQNTSLANEDISVTYDVNFEPMSVSVILDFGFYKDGNKVTQEITVKYGELYYTYLSEIEIPERLGYNFANWVDEDENEITETTQMNKVVQHTIYGTWTKLKVRVVVYSPYATLSGFSVNDVTASPATNEYTINNAEYESQVQFIVTPRKGYHVAEDSVWEEAGFEVIEKSSDNIKVQIIIPIETKRFETQIIANKNTVLLVGEFISEYNIQVDGEPILIDDNTFQIETGKLFRITATPMQGYIISNEIQTDVEGLSITGVNIENNILSANISGIVQDVTLTFTTTPRQNSISINFTDGEEIEEVRYGGNTYFQFDNPIIISVETGNNLNIEVKYKHGYTLDTWTNSDNINILKSDNEDYFQFEISGISDDGYLNLNSKKLQYKLIVKVVSYGRDEEGAVVEKQIKENIAWVNGKLNEDGDGEDIITYLEQATLTIKSATGYTFTGWRKENSMTVFSREETHLYTVEDNETIYAVFSEGTNIVELGAVLHTVIYSEYNEPSKTLETFTDFSSGKFFNQDGQEITSIPLSYGASEAIKFEVPEGYLYAGFGFRDFDETFYYTRIERETNEDGLITEYVSGNQLGSNTDKIYLVIEAREISINVSSKLNISDEIQEDTRNIGHIEIGKEDYEINEYGYIDGTNTHYKSDNFNSESKLPNPIGNYQIITYTGERFLIKIKTERRGYVFDGILLNQSALSKVSYREIDRNETEATYEIFDIVATKNFDSFDLNVIYKPILNFIDLSFIDGSEKVNGGVFNIIIDENYKSQVWGVSGYYDTSVTAYTDTIFEVSVYIRAGYTFENVLDNIIDEESLIVKESINYLPLSIEKTGFTGKLTFTVMNYHGENEIKIKLTPSTYDIIFKDGELELLRIENVAFNSYVSLTAEQQSQIMVEKENYVYQGFFTRENRGGGRQYINSSGEFIGRWLENGYELNSITPTEYILSENAKIVDGKIEISLYLYMSYLKTLIKIKLSPNLDTNYTAEDIVSGIDYTNSWFYISSPLEIEIAYNTNIFFNAPNIAGYKFYKYLITNTSGSGIVYDAVTSYREKTAWVTDSTDNYVLCEVEIVYYREISVRVRGGVGGYSLIQYEYVTGEDGSVTQTDVDAYAADLLAQGYYDSTKVLYVRASSEEIDEGYEFYSWSWANRPNIAIFDNEGTIQIYSQSSQIRLILTLRGVEVNLNITSPNNSHGRIFSMEVQNFDGEYQDEILNPKQEKVRVGDKVTFAVEHDNGFAVIWNRSDINYVGHSNGYSYFEFDISPELANSTVTITPNFESGILSISISTNIENEINNATDLNNPQFAGYVTYDNKMVTNFTLSNTGDVNLGIVQNQRYKILEIILTNYEKEPLDITDLYSDGVLSLSRDFLDSHNIEGNVGLYIEFERLVWEEKEINLNYLSGLGTEDNPYLIYNVDDLIFMMKKVNIGSFANEIKYSEASYVLMNNIDLSEMFWTPIGTESNPFNGKFDFNNYKVSGIYTAMFFEETHYDGLFGVVGEKSIFILVHTSIWYIYLIVGLVVLLFVVLTILILSARRHKKNREELSKR